MRQTFPKPLTFCFQTSGYGILACLHWILIRNRKCVINWKLDFVLMRSAFYRGVGIFFHKRALFQRRTQFHCCVTNKEQKKFLLGNKQERTNLQIGKKRFIKATKSKMVSPPVKKQLESTWSLL